MECHLAGNTRNRSTRSASNRALIAISAIAAAMLAQFALAPQARAFNFDTGNPDVKARWDNTFKYSAAWRLKNRSDGLLVDANMDDGDRNFDKGLVSNRVDLLSELDVSYKKFGMRISGAAWYDEVYNKSNDNNSAATTSQLSIAANGFTDATRKLHGRKVEFLDTYAYGQFDLGSLPTSVRLGRHTLLYGESLFFGGNGIAAGQAPVDVVKLLSVPGTQFKEMLMPVNQVSGQIQIESNISIGGYYQFEWRPNRIPGAGSYLSGADFVGEGSERLFVPGTFGAVYFNRAQDLSPPHSGQGGMQIRWRPEGGGSEFGLYATRYDSKDFTLYLNPAAVPAFPSVGSYSLVYPENIKAYGASFSTVIGEANVAFEVSARRNTPLTSDPVLGFNPVTGVLFDNKNNPNYAVGNSVHAQVSTIYLLKGTPLWQGGDILAELAWHRRTSITKNPTSLDPNVTRDASALRVLFSPQYYQVFPGVDLTVPIGLGYNPSGRSSIDPKFNGGVEHGGDFSVGATFDYRKQVTFGVNYVTRFGSEGTFLKPNQPPPSTILQYTQSLKDRDFLSVFVQSTF